MGLLDQGTPLSWADSQPFIEYVKKHGLLQFINIYKTLHEVETDKFLWGDEIEYCIVQLDPLKKTCKLLLKGKQVQADLDHAFEDLKESDAGEISSPRVATFHPEYAMYMIEGTPGFPYEGFTADLRLVEPNMELRRSLIQNALEDNEFVVSCTSFPLLGFESFCLPWVDEKDGISGPAANSLFVPDSVINDHPRFPCLTQNIRQRRGSKVDIRIPLFKDVYTESRRERETRDCETISMDCMAFGMGCCCLQVTFQARSINDARMLYDQLAVMTPIMVFSISITDPLVFFMSVFPLFFLAGCDCCIAFF